MFLNTCLLISIVLSMGVIQAKVYRKMPSSWPDLVKELKVREQFTCYSCIAASAASCEKKEKVCKQENAICMTLMGIGYALQCADMKYYNKVKQYCDKSDYSKCEVTYCTESLCN